MKSTAAAIALASLRSNPGGKPSLAVGAFSPPAVDRRRAATHGPVSLSSTAFDVGTAPGPAAGPAGGDEYDDMKFIADYMLDAAPADWPATNGGRGPVENGVGEEQMYHMSRNLNGRNVEMSAPTMLQTNNSDRPARQAITGRDRRASWESYTTPSKRNRGEIIGGVIGSPGGVGNWHYSSSYGPATSSVVSGSERRAGFGGFASGSSGAGAASTNNQRKVVTGSERRASFDSFSPLVTIGRPAIAASSSGQANANGGGAASARGNGHDAASVAAALDAMPSSHNVEGQQSYQELDQYFNGVNGVNGVNDVNGGAVDVPMDTPARQSLPPHLSLTPVPGKGLGVVTNVPIASGALVGHYEGEVMSEEVKDRRYLSSLRDSLTDEDRTWIQSRLDRGQTLTGCYLYGVALPDDDVYGRFDRSGGSPATPRRIFVDAEDEHRSLWTRFVNHASPPNDNVAPKSVHESWDGKPKVWFVAKRDIAPGEEICFDYGDDYWLEGDEVY